MSHGVRRNLETYTSRLKISQKLNVSTHFTRHGIKCGVCVCVEGGVLAWAVCAFILGIGQESKHPSIWGPCMSGNSRFLKTFISLILKE